MTAKAATLRAPDRARSLASRLERAQRRVDTWFGARGWRVFDFQREVWDAYLRGESGLVHAATGTGKTLAAWMGPLIEWLAEQPPRGAGNVAFDEEEDIGSSATRRRPRRDSAPGLRILWITPLRALAADTAEALGAPVRSLGLPWTIETRTGDTSAALRARQRTDYAKRIKPGASLGKKLEALAQVRTEEGYMAEIRKEGEGSYLLVENHCPIRAAANACQGFCSTELDLFRSVLGPGVSVERAEHIIKGDQRCVYLIKPQKSTKGEKT